MRRKPETNAVLIKEAVNTVSTDDRLLMTFYVFLPVSFTAMVSQFLRGWLGAFPAAKRMVFLINLLLNPWIMIVVAAGNR